MIFIKYCKICKRAFEVPTNSEICITCKWKEREMKEKRGGNLKNEKRRG